MIKKQNRCYFASGSKRIIGHKFEQPRSGFVQTTSIVYHKVNNVNGFFHILCKNVYFLFGCLFAYYNIKMRKCLLTKRKRYDIMGVITLRDGWD